MLKIKLFLRRHWSELENLSPEDSYFPINDIAFVRELFAMSPSRRYKYGKVSIEKDNYVFLNEVCELDYFVSCIQDDKKEIFSGRTHVIDNSYFRLSFHYHEFLTISFGSKKLSVKKKEFIDAFCLVAEQYYLMLAEFNKDSDVEYYKNQARQVRDEWQ